MKLEIIDNGKEESIKLHFDQEVESNSDTSEFIVRINSRN